MSSVRFDEWQSTRPARYVFLCCDESHILTYIIAYIFVSFFFLIFSFSCYFLFLIYSDLLWTYPTSTAHRQPASTTHPREHRPQFACQRPLELSWILDFSGCHKSRPARSWTTTGRQQDSCPASPAAAGIHEARRSSCRWKAANFNQDCHCISRWWFQQRWWVKLLIGATVTFEKENSWQFFDQSDHNNIQYAGCLR